MSLRKKRINSYCFMQKILYVLSSLDSASMQKILQKISNFFSDDQTFLIMLQDFRPATLLKDTPTQVFSCECCEIFKRNFLQNTSGRLLLKIFPGGDYSVLCRKNNETFILKNDVNLLSRLLSLSREQDIDVQNVLFCEFCAVPLDL